MLQIIASPLIISCGISAFIYFRNPNQKNLQFAISIMILGLVVGIIWANKMRKTKGTLWFISQVNASPDLDNLDNENDRKEN